MTGLQIFGTAVVLVLGLVPPVLMIVFRRQLVEINRRRAERIASRYPSLSPVYRLVGDGQNQSTFVVVAIVWAVLVVGSLVAATVRAIS
jgi:hypothetical protein